METIRQIKNKDKIKELNKSNINDILHLLQPVSYTDTEHQADYYGSGFGFILKDKQQAYIDVLKHNIIKCRTKAQIQMIFNQLNTNINYFPGFVKQDIKRKGQYEFWNTDFGVNILQEWKWMLNKFLSHLNKMVEIP